MVTCGLQPSKGARRENLQPVHGQSTLSPTTQSMLMLAAIATPPKPGNAGPDDAPAPPPHCMPPPDAHNHRHSHSLLCVCVCVRLRHVRGSPSAKSPGPSTSIPQPSIAAARHQRARKLLMSVFRPSQPYGPHAPQAAHRSGAPIPELGSPQFIAILPIAPATRRQASTKAPMPHRHTSPPVRRSASGRPDRHG